MLRITILKTTADMQWFSPAMVSVCEMRRCAGENPPEFPEEALAAHSSAIAVVAASWQIASSCDES